MLRSGVGRLMRRRAFRTNTYTYTYTLLPTTINPTYSSVPTAFQSALSQDIISKSDQGEFKYYENKWKEARKQSLQKGDIVNLNQLLFTETRDYLIKSNNQQVKAEQLEGKVVAIYFLVLDLDRPQHSKRFTSLLMDVYKCLQPYDNFEVVVVPDSFEEEISIDHSLQRDYEMHFEDLFTSMPWTAVPFSDVTSRQRLVTSIGVYPAVPICVVDPTGMVLQRDAEEIFEDFGACGYPFSDEKINFIMAEDDAVAKQPSLKALLTSPERDYVITNKREKVPIQTFEDKVVALYFYKNTSDKTSLTEKLKGAYEELAKIKKIFEVVLVYITEPHRYGQEWGTEESFWVTEESFWEKFKTMPWLALPFGDKSIKKLRRIFEFTCDDEILPELLIFGPHAKFIEAFGSSIMFWPNISRYPFNRRELAELEAEKVTKLKLEMLWHPNTVFRSKDGSMVPFSQLSGKRVMIVFPMLSPCFDDWSVDNFQFLKMLKERYLQTKGSNDEFEVIFILRSDKKSPPSDMPWLVSVASELIDLGSSYYWYGEPAGMICGVLTIFAFNRDGTLIRKAMKPKFEDMEFPFNTVGLEEEMLTELNLYFNWQTRDPYAPHKARVYSYKEL